MDLTKGSIGKTLIKFSLPIVLAFLLQSVYSIADLFVVGHFGGTFALAGVNMGSQIMDFVLGIATGLLAGGRIIIAQYTGSKKTEEVKHTIVTMFQFIVLLSLFLTVLLLILCPAVLQVMHTPAESYDQAKNYYRVCSTGILFIFGYNTVSAVLNGLGDSRTPLVFVVISTVINIILDLTFVGGFGMGAFGAALATVIAQGIAFSLGIFHLIRLGLLPAIRDIFKEFNRGIARDFLRIGIPSCYQNSILNISLVVVIAVANYISVYAAAAVGVCAKLNVIFILPIIALNSAQTVMVGQNVGAEKMDRALSACRMALLITAVYALFVLGLWWFRGGMLLNFFTSDPKTIALGTVYLKAHCWDYFLVMPVAYCLGGLFAGTGHTGVIAVANTVGAVISRIPLCILLGIYTGLGVTGIGMAFPISTAVTVVGYLIPFFRGVWKKSAV
ncbi:MAG: MATE family efflux transporter [Eubacterium sp.]|nr:MATE family efflux transporter [Eubacterium sp.]